MNDRRKYYSERMGSTKEPLKLKDLQFLIKTIFEEYNGKYYFQGAFGYYCVDNGYVPGERGISLEDHLQKTFLGREIFPIERNYLNFNMETCFDLIEYFYDNIGVPINQFYHKWDNCGVHVISADFEKGKSEFREEINPYLRRLEKGYELMLNGEIYIESPDTLKPIVNSVLSSDDEENIDKKVERAKSKFLHHSSNIDDKKESIRILADVLEFLRKDIKNYMFSSDENRLFEIANQFGIRHHNLEQKTDFDKDIWLEWIYYSYLNSINTMVKINRTKV